MDTCWGCKKEDIDVNVELFYKVAPKGDGRVHGIMWNGKKVGGGKLPGAQQLVVQGGGGWLEDMDDDVLMGGEVATEEGPSSLAEEEDYERERM